MGWISNFSLWIHSWYFLPIAVNSFQSSMQVRPDRGGISTTIFFFPFCFSLYCGVFVGFKRIFILSG